jgi:hypothetical protein
VLPIHESTKAGVSHGLVIEDDQKRRQKIAHALHISEIGDEMHVASGEADIERK